MPTSGRVLDLGSGHGLLSLLVADRAEARRVTGVDLDGRKVAAALRAAGAAGVGDRVSFEQVQAGWTPSAGDWDAVVCCDVLYLLGRSAALELVAAATAALRPGGVLLVKEMAARPSWKRRWATLQELAAVRALGITAGERVELVPLGDIVAVMRSGGLVVERVPAHRGYPHPHELVVGRRPTEPDYERSSQTETTDLCRSSSGRRWSSSGTAPK